MMLVMRTPKVIAVMLLVVCSLGAQSRTPTAPAAKSGFDRALDQTVEQGRDVSLPPHISHLLGISPQEQEVPIKQLVIMGEPIRGLEVSKADKNNVVIFVESREKKRPRFISHPGMGSCGRCYR